ncbi:MAG: molybdopterin molybdotransferase MoeA [Erysipelotrichaceae bacterium]|nr:molybdopterin molybdotransferase MoeA [Erysipelotrichaceae bacterium]
MKYIQKLDREIDDAKAWMCYCNPKTWTKWDPTLKKVDVEDELKVGSHGTKYLKMAKHPLDFEVVEMLENQKLVLKSQRGPMTILHIYAIEDHCLVFGFEIIGGNGKAPEVMAEKMKRGIPAQMNRLAMMIKPTMINRREALDKVFDCWEIERKTEIIDLMNALDRTLSEDLYAQVTLPMYRVSMMDGIAVKSSDFANGLPDTSHWVEGIDYARADTGDDFSDDFDAIIQIENVDLNDGHVRLHDIRGEIKAGNQTKPAGSIIQEGTLLFKKGHVIRATDLAVLAMGNYKEVPVFKKPVIAVIPTGSELVVVGSDIHRGENIDSNSFMLNGQLSVLGAEVMNYPIFKDDKESLSNILDEAVQKADIVLINGGSSKGSEDFNIQLLEEKGKLLFHNVSAVPGRPISISMFDNKPVINLPGPALAAYFATDWCLRTLLDKYYMHEETIKHTVKGRLIKPMNNGGPVEICHRMIVTKTDQGYEIEPVEREDGDLKVMSANGVYVSEMFEEAHEIGDILEVEIISR